MLGKDTPLSPDVGVTDLGRGFEISGVLIRNAVLSAALEAAIQPPGTRVITVAMLRRAAAEQLNMPTPPTAMAAMRSA